MTDHEATSQRTGPRWSWPFLVGPVVWWLYFLLTGRAVEHGCPTHAGVVVIVVIALTGATLVTFAYPAWRSAYEGDSGRRVRPAPWAGLFLGILLLSIAVLVGLPLLLSQPC